MLTVTLLGVRRHPSPLPGRALSSLAVTAGGAQPAGRLRREGTQTAARRWGRQHLQDRRGAADPHYSTATISSACRACGRRWPPQGRTRPLLLARPAGAGPAGAGVFCAWPGRCPLRCSWPRTPQRPGPLPVLGGTVQAFPLRHRAPCCGYAFTLPRAGAVRPRPGQSTGHPGAAVAHAAKRAAGGRVLAAAGIGAAPPRTEGGLCRRHPPLRPAGAGRTGRRPAVHGFHLPHRRFPGQGQGIRPRHLPRSRPPGRGGGGAPGCG